jgi:hypothetical protein
LTAFIDTREELMTHRLNALLIVTAALVVPVLTGCGGQKAPETTAEATEQAPPPAAAEPAAPAAETPAPPPAPAPQTPTRNAGTIPEEHATKVPAVAAPETVTLKIPSGTPLALGFNAEVTSETAQVGEAVVATLKEPIVVGSRVAFPAGSQVRGTFSDVKSASKGFKETGGALSIQFSSIVAPDGHKAAISAGFTKVAEGSAAKKGAIIGGSAVAGALLGRVTHKSTGGGAAIGAAVGTAVAGTTKGREAVIKTDQAIQVALDQDARVTMAR